MRHTLSLPFTAGALAFGLISTAYAGPFAPAAGKAGSTALSMDSTSIVQWATSYQDYLPGTGVDATWMTPEKALGHAVGDSYDVDTLGNGGRITLGFDGFIANGAGADFAVFENSFSDTFLELAWVEVSSNGADFFRLPNASLTPAAVGGFGNINPTNIDGLAGKYRQGFGTQFDLNPLAGTAGLDVNKVKYVRIVDVIGNGQSVDTAGRVIYDPYPSTGSAGFDLDAIGVINVAVAPVPEPATWFLTALGLALMGYAARKNSHQNA